MLRFVAFLSVLSLLVCQAVGRDAGAAEEHENFDDLYPADRTQGFDNLNGLLDDDLQQLQHAAKRGVSDRQREIDLAAQQPFYPYGRRTDVPGRPSGFVFGKRAPYFIPVRQFAKRELDEVNPYSVAKRDQELTGLEDFETAKRSGSPYSLSGLNSLSFGKRDPWADVKRADLFGSYAFGKRAIGSNLAFGKRGYGLSSFDFGKRSGIGSSLAFGKRNALAEDGYDGDAVGPNDKRSTLGSSFAFGKRANGLSSFTFGKRAGER